MLAQSMLNPIFVVVGADPLWRNVAGKPDPVLGAVELVPAVVHRGGIDHQDERAPAAGAYRGSGGGGRPQGGLVAASRRSFNRPDSWHRTPDRSAVVSSG